jgi:hypothetical protein
MSGLYSASILALILFPIAAALHASTQSTTPNATPHKAAQAHKRAAMTKQPAVVPQALPVPEAPKLPIWPVNDPPANATVVWNSQGLRIDATNSSLTQILKDVSTATGTKVEGLGSDQRIFGTYGPGSARDVLAKLLDGSGYNVLMIGDQGQGTPRSIVLSTRNKESKGGDAQQASDNQPAANDDNADADEQPQQPQQPPPQVQPPNLRNGFAPGAPPRTPQQIMQEMQQRQEQQTQQPPPPQ